MLRLSIRNLFLYVLAILSCSCALFQFSELEVDFNVTEMNQIMADYHEFWVEFSLDVVKEEAEAAFSVKNSSGEVQGDFSWVGNRLIFSPHTELKAGRRYTISVQGAVNAEDGRKFNLKEVMPFYYLSTDAPPVLQAFSPAPGDAIGAMDDITFTFTTDIDEDSFLDCFSLSPASEFTHVLSADNRTVTLSPEENWSNLSKYTWTISADYKDSGGLIIVQKYSNMFFVIEDVEPPLLESVVPVSGIDIDGTPPYTIEGTALDGAIEYDQGILVTFNEEIDFDLFISAVSINPPPASGGSWYCLDPESRSFLFAPATGWTMNEEYMLDIGDSLTDIYGNVFYMDEPIAFTPAITVLELTSLAIGGTTIDMDLINSDYYAEFSVLPDVLANYQTFSFTFTLPFETPEERDKLRTSISISEHFGGSSTNYIEISAIEWQNANRTADVTLYGFPDYSATQPYYYKLTLAGSFMLDNGSFLEEEKILYLKMVP